MKVKKAEEARKRNGVQHALCGSALRLMRIAPPIFVSVKPLAYYNANNHRIVRNVNGCNSNYPLIKNEDQCSNTPYFVYANGDTEKKEFGDCLHFDTRLIPYRGNDKWVDKVILDIKKCLDEKKPPKSGSECDFCNYREAVSKTEKK